MNLNDFEKCLEPILQPTIQHPSNISVSFKQWFDKHYSLYHGSYDINQRSNECLQEIYNLWIKSDKKARFFWLTSKGLQHEDYTSDNPDVAIDSIQISDRVIIYYRDSKIDDILS